MVEKLYRIEFVDLPGYEHVDMARELSNAYKHGDGWLDPSRANDRVKQWADERGKVDYGRLPIDTFITGVEAFLTALEEKPLP